MNNVDEELRARFAAAASHLPALVASLPQSKLLTFYGLYKQATVGKCSTPQPSWYQFEAKQKWEAWTSLGDTTPEEAISRYIALMTEVAPDWDSGGGGSTTNGWASVSTMWDSDSELDEDEKTVFDHVREGDVSRVLTYSGDLNAVDESRMTLLHWAADRGNVDIAACLLDKGVTLDLTDGEGQTALHYAAFCSHKPVVELLLSRGANPRIACRDGLLPVDVAEDDDIRTMIKRSYEN